MLPVFFAGFGKELQSQANTKERFSLPHHSFVQRLNESSGAKVFHAVPKCANTRQYDAFCAYDFFRYVCDLRFRADCFERFSYGI